MVDTPTSNKHRYNTTVHFAAIGCCRSSCVHGTQLAETASTVKLYATGAQVGGRPTDMTPSVIGTKVPDNSVSYKMQNRPTICLEVTDPLERCRTVPNRNDPQDVDIYGFCSLLKVRVAAQCNSCPPTTLTNTLMARNTPQVWVYNIADALCDYNCTRQQLQVD